MTKILMASSVAERDQSRMPRSTQLSPDNVLRLLQLRNDPVSLEELARSLQVKKGNRGALLAMLAKLQKRGLVEALSHERFLFRRNQRPSPSTAATSAAEPGKNTQHNATSLYEIHDRFIHLVDADGYVWSGASMTI